MMDTGRISIYLNVIFSSKRAEFTFLTAVNVFFCFHFLDYTFFEVETSSNFCLKSTENALVPC